MEEGEGGGDHMDQFRRNEAISAVADDGILGEEEDDDYEDLYNDVNVGENFIQTMRNNNTGGGGGGGGVEDVFEEKKVFDAPAYALPPSRPQELNQGVPIPGVRGNSNSGGVGFSGDLVGPGYQNQGFGGHDVKGIVGSGPSVGRGGGGLRVELGQGSIKAEPGEPVGGSRVDVGGVQGFGQHSNVGVGGGSGSAGMGNVGNVASLGNEALVRQGGGGNMNGGYGSVHVPGNSNIGGGPGAGAIGVAGSGGGANNMAGVGGGSGGGGTILFVGDLHWWTTDAELEAELCKHGHVKEVKFFDEKASGKSKGYCQVEFYDPAASATCKEGMNGHLFNGRPCVVAFASPFSVKRMGEAQVNRNQQMAQSSLGQARCGPNDPPAKTGGNNIAAGGNYQGGDNNRGYGRGNWRGNAPGMTARGPVGPRNRGGGMGGRGIMGNGGNGFGQSMGGTPPLLHPQSMMGQGFDPAFGGPMGRMGNYGGFPGVPAPPFAGMMPPSFLPVGGVSFPGVAPHVNPAFFGRGMPMNAMGMMPTSGIEGPNMGMWSDPNMGGWGGEDHGGGRAGESSYGEEAASEHQYGEVYHERGNWPPGKDKDRSFEKDWSGSSERRYRDDKESGYEREMPREEEVVAHDNKWLDRRQRDDRDVGRDRERERERDRERSRDRDRDRDRERDRERDRDDRNRYADQYKHGRRDMEQDDNFERGRSSRTHSKSRAPQEDDHRSRSRDADYGKRRRLTSD